MVACALVLGRAVGGNWISWDQTWSDFIRRGWPALAIAVAAGFMHRRFRPTAEIPRPPVLWAGVIPGAAYLAASLLIVAMTDHGLDPSQW
jgi:hypothetical protein